MKLFFENGDQDVGRYGTPDLGLHRVLARAQKFLYSQVLLDPFEEQLHLPALLVKRGDGQRRQGRIIGQKNQCLSCLGIPEANAPQVLGIILRGKKAGHGDRLVANWGAQGSRRRRQDRRLLQ